MIFVSLGTNKYPFERLVRTVDELEPELDHDVFVQAGSTLDAYEPKNVDYADYVSRDEYDGLVEEADLFVTHGGTGSIITAIETGTPAVLFPRAEAHGESGYDFAETARGWEHRRGIEMVTSTDDLERVLREDDLEPPAYDGDDADLRLTVADILADRADGAPDEDLTVFCPTPPGGHLTQLLRVEDELSRYGTHFVTWDEEITGSIDGVEIVDGYHTEEFPNPGMLKDLVVTNTQVAALVARHRPDLVLSTGGGALVIYTAYLAKLVGADVVHIESRSRFENRSTTGRILYPIADRFFAQHPNVVEEYGEKAEYEGALI